MTKRRFPPEALVFESTDGCTYEGIDILPGRILLRYPEWNYCGWLLISFLRPLTSAAEQMLAVAQCN